jgi:hypothetical protein
MEPKPFYLPTFASKHCGVVAYNKKASVQALHDALDLVDEARDIALARIAVYQQVIRNYHS